MNRPRFPLRSRRSLAILAALTVLVAAGIAQAALSSNGSKPPPKPLDAALQQGLSATDNVRGVTARVSFTNRLIDRTALSNGRASPLISGASGRLWLADDGRFRLELQSSSGDAQVVSNGRQIVVYDASANTLYRLTLPSEPQRRPEAPGSGPPNLAQIRRALDELGRNWNLTGALPSNVAGKPAYTLTISPQHDGGLLGAISVAWDAARGVPLRIAVNAQGQRRPVLELKATSINYGSVPASRFKLPNPSEAKVVEVTPPGRADQNNPQGERKGSEVRGVAAVQAKVPFRIAAPRQLIGLKRQDVWLIKGERQPGAVAVYGQGLGAIAVLQSKPEAGKAPAANQGRDSALPTISVNGSPATVLSTALGTGVTFERDGVAYTLVGSVPAAAAETAARELTRPAGQPTG